MALSGWSWLVRTLHPAWRKERRVLRACEQVFDEDEYRPVRIRVRVGEPSLADVLPQPSALWGIPRYFTYDIEAEAAPDFSEASPSQRHLVRRYMQRNASHVHHHGREPLRPRPADAPSSPSADRSEQDGRPRLVSAARLNGRNWWFARMELRPHAVVIAGWTWGGRATERIPMDRLLLVETWAEREGTNVRFEIDGAPPLRGRIEKGLGLWEAHLDSDERVALKRRVDY